MGRKKNKSLKMPKMPKIPKLKGGSSLPNPAGGPVPGGPSSGVPAPAPGQPPIPGMPAPAAAPVGGAPPSGLWGLLVQRLQYLNESKYFA